MIRVATGLLLLLLSCAASARAAPDVGVQKDRPRMLVTPGEVRALRAKCKGPGREMFAAMKGRADGMLRTPARLDNNGRHYLPTYAFLFLVTGEKSYANKAKEWLELLARETIQNPWSCLEYIPVASFAYDWLHPVLTGKERARFADGIVRQVTRIEKLWRHSDYNNHFLLEHMAMLHAGLALAHEKHHEAEWRSYLKRAGPWLTAHVIPAMNEMAGEDGGDAEGFSYANWGVERPLAMLLLAWRTATGEDLFAGCSFLRHAARWNLYGRKPDGTMCRSEDCPSTLRWAQMVKPTFAICAAAYDDPRAQWIFDQVEDRYPQLLWSQLATWDPRLESRAPDDLDLATVFRPLGHVYTRSAWQGEDATWAMFQCGPIFAGHQHLDNASFVIHKRGALAIDSGVNEYSSHRANYYSRSIAHNTILVENPQEVFPDAVWSFKGSGGSNDGGQRRVEFPQRATASAEEKARRDVGRIVAFRSRAEYSYACGDASRSYLGGDKLRTFTRQFLHLRPDTFVVFDLVVATSPKFPKTWLLHSMEEPEIDAGDRTFRVEHGGGRLDVWSLLPEGAAITKVGGPGKEFWVNGRNYPPTEKSDPGAGAWRTEVRPANAGSVHCFLHVLHASSVDAGEAPPEVLLASVSGTFARLVIRHGTREARIEFRKSGNPGGRIQLTSDRRRVLDEKLPFEVELQR